MSQTPESYGMDSKPIAERDRIDLNHEISGSDVGRIQRFMSEDIRSLHGENSEKKKSERAMTMLMYLLENDPQYAKRYFEVAEKLDKAQQAVDRALIDINQRLAVSDRELLKMEENSAKAEDGTSVFKSSHGSIYTSDGQRLSDEDAKKITVPDGAPSWEAYKAEKEKREAFQRSKDNIERYERDVLNPAQERMKDEDNPVSLDDLDEIEAAASTQVPAELNDYFMKADVKPENTSLSVAHTAIDKTQINTPDLRQSFETAARTDIPDFGIKPSVTNAPAAPAM